MLILFFLYLGYIGLATAEKQRGGEGRLAAIFGLVVFLVMRLVVLPLSAFRPGPPAPAGTIDWGQVNLWLAHVFFVGLPIAFATRWAARR